MSQLLRQYPDQPTDSFEDAFIQMAFERLSWAVAGCFLDESFSGVFLRDGSCVYLVTAGHAVRSDDWNDLKVISRGRPLAKARGKFRMLALPKEDRLDVAVLELDPEFAAWLKVCPLERQSVGSRAAKPGKSVLLIGFPQQLASKAGSRLSVVRPAIFLARITKTSLRKIAQSVCLEDRPNRKVDIYLDGDPKGMNYGADPSRFNPKGLSGSPVFTIHAPPSGGLYSSDQLKLCGIQSGSLLALRLLRVVKCEYALATIDRARAI
ncbi:MAG: trypsin-like peptidase domain-containing protein [Planctomycetes bacterium]|nr:trypsin-like peptidase domain-containing protein [Planctomycetota bacterium]